MDTRTDVEREKEVQLPRGRASKRSKSFLLRETSSSCSQRIEENYYLSYYIRVWVGKMKLQREGSREGEII